MQGILTLVLINTVFKLVLQRRPWL